MTTDVQDPESDHLISVYTCRCSLSVFSMQHMLQLRDICSLEEPLRILATVITRRETAVNKQLNCKNTTQNA